MLKSEDDWRKLKDALDMHRTGSLYNYKLVAGELFRQNIKGRNGHPLSTKTIARLRQELERAGQR